MMRSVRGAVDSHAHALRRQVELVLELAEALGHVPLRKRAPPVSTEALRCDRTRTSCSPSSHGAGARCPACG